MGLHSISVTAPSNNVNVYCSKKSNHNLMVYHQIKDNKLTNSLIFSNKAAVKKKNRFNKVKALREMAIKDSQKPNYTCTSYDLLEYLKTDHMIR